MNYEIYTDLTIASDLRVFDFVSIGNRGHIPKRVAFIPTESADVDNLAFGDFIPDSELDYFSISDNGDRNKVLATIAKVIDIYTEKYPQRWIYFQGSTNERNRLYRMAVSINLKALLDKFDIYVEVEGSIGLIPFDKNLPAIAFLIKRKID